MNRFITRRTISLLMGFMVLIALPVALLLVRQRQDLRQRASTADCVRADGTINAYPDAGSCSFQDAYTLAQAGDVILLNPGTYVLPDDFFIEKSVAFRSVTPQGAIVKGTEENPVRIFAEPSLTGQYTITFEHIAFGPWIQIVSSQATGSLTTLNINNNSFTGTVSTMNSFLPSFIRIGNNILATITDNNFSGTGKAVIIIDPVTAPDQNSVIRNNTIDGDFEDGLWIFGTAKVDIQNNSIDVNKTVGFGRGINLGDTSTAIIKNNLIKNSGMGIAAFDTPTIQNIATFPDGNGFGNNTVNCQSFSNTVFSENEPIAKTKCPDGTIGGPLVTPIPTATPTPTGSAAPTPTPTGTSNPTPSPTPTGADSQIYNPKADLNDDGPIDEFDLNILYRGFETRTGD